MKLDFSNRITLAISTKLHSNPCTDIAYHHRTANKYVCAFWFDIFLFMHFNWRHHILIEIFCYCKNKREWGAYLKHSLNLN